MFDTISKCQKWNPAIRKKTLHIFSSPTPLKGCGGIKDDNTISVANIDPVDSF